MRMGWKMLAVAGLALASWAEPVTAQQASQRGQVRQTIDGTELIIDYGRPIARGREIFGSLMDWGYVWTPGANQSTVFEIDTDISLNGHEVPAGKYSLWMISAEDGPWEVLLEPDHELFHTEKPKPDGEGQVRFMVEPVQGPHQEVLTFAIPELGPTFATVEMRWENTIIPLHIETPVDYVTTVDPDEAAQYVGTYEMHWTPEVLEERGREDTAIMVDIWIEEDQLRAQPDNWPDPYSMILLPMADGIFMSGTLVGGHFTGTGRTSFYEFTFGDGEVTGFQHRNAEDRLMRTATKLETDGTP